MIASNNGLWGLAGDSVRGQHVTAQGNGTAQIGAGVSGERVVLVDATITGNNGLGVAVDGSVKITGGTVTGNGIDIASPTRPRLTATTCDVSQNYVLDPPVSWGSARTTDAGRLQPRTRWSRRPLRSAVPPECHTPTVTSGAMSSPAQGNGVVPAQ